MSQQEKFWQVAQLTGLLLVVFLAVMSIKELKSIAYVGKSDQVVNTISVNGKGEVMTKPDIATFSFSITENAKTVIDAQNKATTKINSALKVVRDNKIEDKDIQTTSYTINPHYEYQSSACAVSSIEPYSSSIPCRPSKQILTGYDVSQTIQVKVRDLDKAGALFSAIGSLGVQNVNGLDFSVDNPESIKSQAREKAIENAKEKAEKLADQLGVKIVRITSYYESGDQTYAYYGMGGGVAMNKAESAPVAAPEIPAGEQKVVSNVTVTYEIE